MDMGLLDWLYKGSKHRRGTRYEDPGVIAFYWDGSVPSGRQVRDISHSGVYLLTEDRWYIGTLLTTVLKADNAYGADGKPESVTVRAQVVRHGTDGIGLSFVFRNSAEQEMLDRFMTNVIPGYRPRRAMGTHGASLVEFALLVPLLFLLSVALVDFGGLLFAWVTVSHAARSGADYAIQGGIQAGYPITPKPSQISDLISNELAGLPNNSSLSVSMCTRQGTATPTALLGSCSNSPSDTEVLDSSGPFYYTLIWVDVTYTYIPFVGALNFSSLGIQLPAIFGANVTIHRRAVMRAII